MRKIRIIMMLMMLFTLAASAIAEDPIGFIMDSLNFDDLPETYHANHTGIDLIIYLLIFGSALNMTIRKHYGLGTSLGLTIALSIGMIIFEEQKGFMVGDFGWIAILVLSIIIGAFVYKHLPERGKNNWLLGAVFYIIAYIIWTSEFPYLVIDFKSDHEWVFLFLQLFLALSVLVVLNWIHKLLKKGS